MASPLPKTHSAVQLDNPGPNNTLTLNSGLPLPVPKEGEVLVRSTYGGINYIDTYFRSGLYAVPHLPNTLGREGEGIVVALGPGVADSPDTSISSIKVGDRVAHAGTDTYAEYVAVLATRTIKLSDKIPSGLGAASMIQGLTAVTLVRESYPAKKGDWVIVHAAAGGMGLLLTQILSRTIGAHVIATASTEEKLQIAKANGAEVLINYKDTDWVAEVRKVKEVQERGGVDAILDGVGKVTFDGGLEVLRRKGTFVSFGNASGAVEPFALARLASKNLKILRPQLYGYIGMFNLFSVD